MAAELQTAIARWPSRCAACDERIEEGDEIALLEEDDEWVHRRCAEAS